MAGNTRGKLKEEFEGIHRNFDWVIAHVNKSLILIGKALENTDEMIEAAGDELKREKIIKNHFLYKGISGVGSVVQTLDDMVMQLYSRL